MVALFVLAACSSIDCPLNNRVYATFRLDAGMKTMEDTLTVAVPRAADYKDDDTVIINRLAGFDSIALPMSYQRAVDVYVFGIKQKDSDVSTTDTVWVTKENNPHFESVDCGVNYFHTITGVRHTSHTIDSVTINKRNVNYDASVSHLYIYFRSEAY